MSQPQYIPMSAPTGLGASIGKSLPQQSKKPLMPAPQTAPQTALQTAPSMGTPPPAPTTAMTPLGSKAMAARQSLQSPAPTGRAFNAPVQNQLGTMTFKNLQPRNGLVTQALAGRPGAPIPTDEAGKPMYAPPTAMPQGTVDRPASTNGFNSFVNDKIGAAGFIKSGADRKPGWVAQKGEYRGKTRDEAQADLRMKYAAMSPDQKAVYEQKAANLDIGDMGNADIGDSAPAPATAPRVPVGTPDERPYKLRGLDGTKSAREAVAERRSAMMA